MVFDSKFDVVKNNNASQEVIAEMDNTLNSDDLVDIGEKHHQAGQLQEAESAYRKALEVDPGHPGALYFLANIAYDDGRLSFATQLIDELLRDESSDAEAWHLLGMIAFKEESFSRAIECLNKALEIQPTYVQAHCSLGNVFSRQGELDAALGCYQNVLSLNSGCGEAYFGIGNVLRLQNQPDKAIDSYRRAIALNYSAPQVHVCLATALMFNGQHVEAKASLECAIALDPSCADAYRNLGSLLIMQGDISAGIAALQQAVSLNPKDGGARTHLALALYATGRLTDAIDGLEEAIRINPNNAEARSILLGFHQYLPDYPKEKIFSEHVAFGEFFEAPVRKNWPRYPQPVSLKKRLRVGFVSGDLYSHPVGFFLEGVLRELSRRDEIDIVVYAMNTIVDALTDRLREAADVWRSVSALSDNAFEQRVREDRLDILIDLSGHTVPNRLLVFARKPAPIQVTWLGYWETTGLRAIDYIFCDRVGVHGDEGKYFVEKPWYLPHTRLCFTLPNESLVVAPPPALSKGYVTFGCFNKLVKMTDSVVAVWARVLKRMPDARLLLKSISFNDLNIRESVTARFAAEGISADRLELEVNSPRQEYFSAYNRVDIALDPFPFPGGTTSVEGIWMGVPMITLRGDRIISRQGESILHNLGLQDWIAANEDDYVELAVRKAGDLSNLAKLRSQLREKLEVSPLCDAQLFAQHLEQAFKKMWDNFCQNP